MDKRVKLKLNKGGVRSLLKSPEMAAVCMEQAQKLQSRCGQGYEVEGYTGKNRVNAMIWPQSAQARQDNYKNNTLEKALGGRHG